MITKPNKTNCFKKKQKTEQNSTETEFSLPPKNKPKKQIPTVCNIFF